MPRGTWAAWALAGVAGIAAGVSLDLALAAPPVWLVVATACGAAAVTLPLLINRVRCNSTIAGWLTGWFQAAVAVWIVGTLVIWLVVALAESVRVLERQPGASVASVAASALVLLPVGFIALLYAFGGSLVTVPIVLLVRVLACRQDPHRENS